ncbi:cysteine hydrolase family protein [Deinococcus aquaedulcis]|uniref:isochorismatase n=1 Tax=Deinococcus aquaedulcis TaxID=2840455 RepID=UPI001C82CE4F|nr:isochorismatase [Deinococcus aquaedulcis]
MPLTPHALLLLHAQRAFLDGRADERALARAWAHQTLAARANGWLVAVVQWDAPPGADWTTLFKPWTLHPDFRVEHGDLLVRAGTPDAFADSDLGAALHTRAVQTLHPLGLPDTPEWTATLAGAQAQGFVVAPLKPL